MLVPPLCEGWKTYTIIPTGSCPRLPNVVLCEDFYNKTCTRRKLEQHNNSCHGFRLSQPLGLIKTDEYGDAYLNTSYIKAKILFIRNKDYFTFISTNTKTEKYTIKMQKDNSQEYRKKRARRIIEDMLNNVHTLDELKEFKKKIKDIPLSPIIE